MGNGPHRCIDFPGGDVTAFDKQFTFDVRLTSVGDVKHRKFGEAAGSPRVVTLIPPHGFDHRMVGLDSPWTHSGNHDELIAIKHHGHGRPRQGDVGNSLNFAKFRYTKDMEMVFLEVIDVVAVGLQEIGFVNTGFLVVGAREILALNARWCSGSGLGTVGSFGDGPVVRHHLSILCPTKAVEVRVGNSLKKLNSVFFFDGLFERLFQFFAIIVGKKLGAGHRSCRDG